MPRIPEDSIIRRNKKFAAKCEKNKFDRESPSAASHPGKALNVGYPNPKNKSNKVSFRFVDTKMQAAYIHLPPWR